MRYLHTLCLAFFVLFPAFSSLATAQTTCSSPVSAITYVRSEGLTEQVGDLTFSCIGPGGTATLQVFLSPTVKVTSAVLSATSGHTEALATTTAGSVQGVIDPSGLSLTFTGLTIPAAGAPGAQVTIRNVRVDATALTVTAGAPVAIKESVFLLGTGITPTLVQPTSVAYAVPGLAPTSIADIAGGVSASIPGCGRLPAAAPAFTLKIREALGSAFKQRGSAGINTVPGNASAFNTETGFIPAAWPNTPGASNIANSGTRVRIELSNVPANAQVYLPVSIQSDFGATGTITLTASETGPFAPIGASTPDATNGLPAAGPMLGLVSATGRTVAAVYEVTTSTAAIETFTVPVYFGWAANTVTGDDTAIQVRAGLAPAGVTGVIPSFGPNTSAPLTGPTISICRTTLLFPFVSTQLGFDTAIVLANTSSDPLGAAGAVAQSGSCNLNFYGTGAPSPSTHVPLPDISGQLLPGQLSVFTLSSIAAGFQGYIIAACDFNYVHGFAGIFYNAGMPSGTSIDYIAPILPRGGGAVVDTTTN